MKILSEDDENFIRGWKDAFVVIHEEKCYKSPRDFNPLYREGWERAYLLARRIRAC